MVFWIKKNEEGKWQWRLRSAASGADIAHCLDPTDSEKECFEVVDRIKRGAAEADVRFEKEPT